MQYLLVYRSGSGSSINGGIHTTLSSGSQEIREGDEYDDDERCSEDKERHHGERRDYAQEQGGDGRGDGCVQAGGLNVNAGPPCWHEVVIKTMLHPVDGRCEWEGGEKKAGLLLCSG